MRLQQLELAGFKSFAKKSTLSFDAPITAIVGPNGSGKSNIAEAFRFVLGEQSMKSMRGRRGEDLIFGGSKGAARANRATVKVTFDNSDRTLDIDYDTVTIERVVFRDGVNQYLVNGSQVRLRDVYELLAGAHIGATGHHIISQGEADRILSANIKERREMVEEALGLKIYQYKKAESQKKLEKTRENIKEIETLRREIAPHLRFLKKQVERVERAREMREELKSRYKEYLKRESEFIAYEEARIARERTAPESELERLNAELAAAKEKLEATKQNDEKSSAIISLEGEIQTAREEKDACARELGRIEGQVAFLERERQKKENAAGAQAEETVLLADVAELETKIGEIAEEAEKEEDASALRTLVTRAYKAVQDFIEEKQRGRAGTDTADETVELEKLTKEQEELNEKYEAAAEKEKELSEKYQALQKEIESVKDKSRDAEREMFRITTRQNELRNALQALENRRAYIERVKQDFDREVQEGGVLVGRAVFDYETYRIMGENNQPLSQESIASEEREKQEERRRAIEKIKIRLEDAGSGTGEEIIKEHKEVSERDEFLARELADLEQSAEKLVNLITELEQKLDAQFKAGIAKINKEFNSFFGTLFGGGSASLAVVKQQRRKSRASDSELLGEDEEDMEEDEASEGIDINVTLPHKRIKGLEVLSGGERSLTSIALIFAMSQVNPPPFLILDETDAALDEANAKKYGEMIQKLAEKSQLILVTHNRETMRHAGILYGVTMGVDAVSKLLSVKFEEAAQNAAR